MIFIDNKYTRISYTIIDRAQSRTLPQEIYTEKHHIIPRSLGGADTSDNLAILTAREHYACHLLLPKMLEGENKYKMLCAIIRISHSNQPNRVKVPSRVYESVKLEKNKMHSQLFRGENNPFYGKKHTKETIEKLKIARALQVERQGDTMTLDAREKLSRAAKGRTLDNDHKQKIAEAHKGKPKKKHEKTVCPHCNKITAIGAGKRWHFDHCKLKLK